jgi:alpha-galactosidase
MRRRKESVRLSPPSDLIGLVIPLAAMPAPPLVTLDGVGHVEPVRVGVRFVEQLPGEGSGAGAGQPRVVEAPLREGRIALDGFEVHVSVHQEGPRATCGLALRNVSGSVRRLDACVLGLRWRPPPGVSGLRFLKHGWQSWSFTGGRDLETGGEPPFPSGPWLRGLHHALGEPPADRAGWHESHMVTVVGESPDGPACLLGALEAGRSFGLVYARSEQDYVDLELELRLEVPLEPSARCEPEPIQVALGPDAGALLESYADELGRRAGARCDAPFQSGWCTWYHFFDRIDEATFLRNLEALTALRDELPIDVVQLDDGYQRAVGDWLETNEKFPSGLERLAREIRTAGFVPGLWTAPFCAVPESRLHQDRPHWLLRHGSELHRGLVHGVWAREGWVHVLDTSREDVLEHLRAVFASLVEMGFTYLKLDFLYVVAMQADAADPSLTRAARLRQGLEAIRRGAGDDAFLLGCGCPMGPAVGIVDGMRIGPDVAPSWEIEDVPRIPGIEATQPSTRNAVRNVLARAWMHRRLWLNDPDCLMTRSDDTRLSADERRTLAAVVAASGGMTIFSDDVPRLSEESRHLVRDTLELARAVDRSGRRGTARARGLLLDEMPSGLHARAGSASLLAWVNHTDSPESPAIDLPEHDGFRSEALLGTVPVATQEGRRTIPPHATSLVRYDRPVRLAVFCDFDGTFAVQDVGATLARRHAGDRRPALWARLERGELSAWEYNLELLDGLELPKAVLEDFLRSVELSPGADELVRWCESQGVPFRVLSDGFDYNLDRLQEIHQIRFEYEANRLRYEGGSWRIEAGFPNPSCSCGTGTCKRGRIETFRREHPGASVVHIGNGRVSDLCAALASDVVFAKDTLADELVDRGVPFEPFDTLRDALPVLERLLAGPSTSES